jgi:hypothetical protein
MVRIQLYPDKMDTHRLQVKLNLNVMPKQKTAIGASTEAIAIPTEKKVNF